MEKKKLQKLSLNKESICSLSAKDQMYIHGGGEGTTSFNNNCTHGPICCDPGKTESIPKSCCLRCETNFTDSQGTMCVSHNIGDYCQSNDIGGARAGGDCTGTLSAGGPARAGGDCTAYCGDPQ